MSRFKKRHRLQQHNNASRELIRVGITIVCVVALVFVMRWVVKGYESAIVPAYPDVVDANALSRNQLIKKVTELQDTLASYNSQIAGERLLENENAALKAELGRDPKPSGILADVLTLPNRSFYDTFVIDAGSVEGIRVDQEVYAFNSIALGTVTSVEDHTAVVSLFSAPDRQTTGTAVGSDVAVTLIGRGGGEYEVRMPRDVHFETGSSIALQSVYPAVLAEVSKITTDPRDPFQRLLAKAPVNFTALKWVIVR